MALSSWEASGLPISTALVGKPWSLCRLPAGGVLTILSIMKELWVGRGVQIVPQLGGQGRGQPVPAGAHWL